MGLCFGSIDQRARSLLLKIEIWFSCILKKTVCVIDLQLGLLLCCEKTSHGIVFQVIRSKVKVTVTKNRNLVSMHFKENRLSD